MMSYGWLPAAHAAHRDWSGLDFISHFLVETSAASAAIRRIAFACKALLDFDPTNHALLRGKVELIKKLRLLHDLLNWNRHMCQLGEFYGGSNTISCAYFFFAARFSSMAACAAARRATGTRKGEQLT